MHLENYQKWKAGQDELKDWNEIERLEIKSKLLRKPVRCDYTNVTPQLTQDHCACLEEYHHPADC